MVAPPEIEIVFNKALILIRRLTDELHYIHDEYGPGVPRTINLINEADKYLEDHK